MSDDTRIALILGSAILIAGGTAWYCRNDEAMQWKQKYEESQQQLKESQQHADYKFNHCMNQFRSKP